MNVLYLINYAGKGGTEKYVRDLVEDYHGKRAQCFFAYNIDGPLVEYMQGKGVPCIQIKMRSAYDIFAAKKVADFCKKNKIDIIHTQFPRENYIAVLSKLFYKKTKLFNTSHLIMNQGAVWRVVNKFLSGYDEKIFSVCRFGKDTLVMNGVPEDKIEVVFNGIPIIKPYRLDKVKKELGISDDTFVISALTRYSAEKGIPFLIDTVFELKKMVDKKFAVLIAGDGDSYKDIREKIRDLELSDVVYQLGYRNDAQDILACSDLFVNLSSTEALSFAILEALGQGVPVVATDVGGTNDIINAETRCGSLVEYGKAFDAAKEIARYLNSNDLCSKSSECAIETVKQKFNIKNMLDTVYDRYEKALK